MTAPAPLSLFERLDAALPQTQCTRCGYPDCASYAQAIVAGQAAINQCPPGGAEGVARLARIAGLPPLPLNPDNGREGPRAVAWIDEAWCIGCTLCIKACPVDAIVGSNKRMHTVIEADCTGCELCIPVCPVDCIELENVTGERSGWAAWSPADAEAAKQRYGAHRLRRASGDGYAVEPLEDLDEPATPPAAAADATADKKRSIIEAALARARAQRQR